MAELVAGCYWDALGNQSRGNPGGKLVRLLMEQNRKATMGGLRLGVLQHVYNLKPFAWGS